MCARARSLVEREKTKKTKKKTKKKKKKKKKKKIKLLGTKSVSKKSGSDHPPEDVKLLIFVY